MLPGPTPIPERARLAGATEMIGHREVECEELLKEVVDGLKYVFQTENDVLVLTCSGTGGLEGSIANTLSKGDKVLSLCTGAFGERYASIAENYGLEVERLNVPWGECIDPKKVEEKLESYKDGEVKAILMTHNETSTGVINHPEPIGKLARKYNCLLLIDAVSSLAGIELKTDEWGADVVVTSSQKALMSPPGLCLVSVSSRAFKAYETSDLPKFYLDFKRAKDRYDAKNQTPATPAISVLYVLREVLRDIKEEGLENVFKRHEIVTKAIRLSMKAIGLELLVDDKVASKTVTAVKLPEGISYSLLRNKLKDEYNVYVTGSKGQLQGKVFRIGHLGNVSRMDILSTISALEFVLLELGFELELGAGLSAAQKVFYEEERSK
jgi:aspartate aminotransferase-like enzyme